MPIIINIPDRRTTRSVLWNPRLQNAPPRLVIGRLQAGNPPTLEGIRRIDLRSLPDALDLFEVAAANCGLDDGVVYQYWFEVDDSRSAHRVTPRRSGCGGAGDRAGEFLGLRLGAGNRLLDPDLARPALVGKKWVEVTQRRDVGPGFEGREAIFAWERILKLMATSEKGMKRSKRSRCGDRVAPLVGCLGSEDPQRGA